MQNLPGNLEGRRILFQLLCGFYAKTLRPAANRTGDVDLADPRVTTWQDKMAHGFQVGV